VDNSVGSAGMRRRGGAASWGLSPRLVEDAPVIHPGATGYPQVFPRRLFVECGRPSDARSTGPSALPGVDFPFSENASRVFYDGIGEEFVVSGMTSFSCQGLGDVPLAGGASSNAHRSSV
jgi:hypothetical protein